MGLVILGSIGMLAITAYSTQRHGNDDGETTKDRAVRRLIKLPAAMVDTALNFKLFGEQGALFDGQNAVWCGLLTIQLTERGQLARDPFATPVFVAVNPIPRSLWPEKPIGLGKILPQSMGEPVVTWGPSLIGHSFYDGGWPIVFLYGLGCGLGLRFLDLRMLDDPTNPWRIVVFTSVLGHFIGMPRGDCGTFLVNILGPIVLISLTFRLLIPKFGSRPSPYHATSHVPHN